MKYANEPRDSDGYIATFRKGMEVRVLSTNEMGTVEQQHLVLAVHELNDSTETYWGNVDVILQDGSIKTFINHQIIRTSF